ncbi:MAG: SDR family oxidoreductase [Myxococcota bacterium]|nr:SDR family oxidoreductase [Myxococcota bacterium]
MTASDLPATSLSGLNALVCGASKGIGRAIALTFASRGASVTVLARSEESLVGLLPELAAAGSPAPRAVVADLDDREGLCDQVATLLAEAGPMHILVNNGGGPPGGPILDAAESEFLIAFGRHVLASHLLVGLLLPGMRQESYGRILNVVSTSVREPIPNLGVSNTTRGAVASWAKSVSRELPPGVTINNLLPGFTDTERLGTLGEAQASRRGVSREQVKADWLAEIPEGRLGRPDELAAMAAFLASPAGAYVRGQSIAVDGGRLRSI